MQQLINYAHIMHVTEKAERQQHLVRILARGFSRQEEVVSAMQEEGFAVTQSSVSRDLKELGVAKRAGRYVPPESEAKSEVDSSLLGFHSLDSAGPNMLVIKTPIATASVIAGLIDSSSIPGVVGTVAGDDTIFVAVKGKAAERELNNFLVSRVGTAG